MLHFIRVYTVCKGKKDIQKKESFFFFNYNLTPLDIYNRLSKVYCIKTRRKNPLAYKGLKILCLQYIQIWVFSEDTL